MSEKEKIRPCFEIGFVLSGAISAGAYTAGVVDFFIEALDAYYAERDKWDGPTHDVRVPIITGASAGGMTGSIFALQAFHDIVHVQPGAEPPAEKENRLYWSWVKTIDISGLLETGDLAADERKNGVKSLLCSRIIDDIVRNAPDMSGNPRARPWVGQAPGRGRAAAERAKELGSDQKSTGLPDSGAAAAGADDAPAPEQLEKALRLRLTVSNMRGVPYAFDLLGAANPERKFYGMLNYGDYREFKIGVGTLAEDGGCVLNLESTAQADKDWDEFLMTTKATGAFPIGLAPRTLWRPGPEYAISDRVGFDVFETVPGTPPLLKRGPFKRVKPHDSLLTMERYDFVAVDGGMIDNEPLELARRYLAGGHGFNNRSGDLADRAIVMVSPFPNYLRLPEYDKEKNINSGERIVDIAPVLLGTCIGQARFKPSELQLAADPTVFSRFLVAPQRLEGERSDGKNTEIACGILGGFGGFLHKSFRRHDYLLGRRNAQAFLRWHFNLSEDNPLFAGFDVAKRDKWYVRETGPGGERAALKTTSIGETRKNLLPIIPLTDRLKEEIVIPREDYPDWEVLAGGRPERAVLDQALRKRAETVAAVLIDQDMRDLIDIGGVWKFLRLEWAVRGVAGFGARKFISDALVKKATAAIDGGLKELRDSFAPEKEAAPTAADIKRT